MTHQTENLIIGAGPAGLAMAGRFSHHQIPYILIEQSDTTVNAWRNHYDRVHLHTIKRFSYLPYREFPEEYPLYVPREKLVEYYDNYCKDFEIQPVTNQEAISVKKTGKGWETQTKDGNIYLSQNVIVCTGYNRVVNVPVWPGMENFQGIIWHSREYRNGSPFKGKKVLVVGMGNTGAELAIDLHEHGAIPFLSVRGPVNITLRDLNGRPTQLTAIQLQKLPTWMGDWIGKQLSRLAVGNLEKYGIPQSTMAPAKQLRLYGKTPVIDVGTIKLIKEGKVKVLPVIQSFTQTGIIFTDNREESFDAVILATGYHPKVEEFIEDTTGIFNELGLPGDVSFEQHPGLYFLGFDAYTSGILNSIHRNSEVIVNKILGGEAVGY